MRLYKALPALLLALLPAACGDLPQPFRNRPGMQATRLAIPLALRLAIPSPTQALMTNEAGRVLAEALAAALQAEELPAVATETPLPLDWRIDVVAQSAPGGVVPRYRLLDADGQEQGVVAGAPLPPQLWTSPTAAALRPYMGQAARALSALLLQVEAARKQMDPVALAGGPARVRFGGVTGAPGDGNTALATRMRVALGNYGYVIQEVADGATFGLEGRVHMVAQPNNIQRVELVWRVSRRDGEELGQVVQMNEVPAGSLNRPWGDVAYVVAEEAAGGVRQVLVNATNAPALPSLPAGPPGSAPPPPAMVPPRPALVPAAAAQPIVVAPPAAEAPPPTTPRRRASARQAVAPAPR